MGDSSLKVRKLIPGSFYIQMGNEVLLAGCPPEITKVLVRKKLHSPQYVLLPDEPIRDGNCQTSVEFILYHHLFFGPEADFSPLVLIGQKKSIEAAQRVLKLCLFGPSKDEMLKAGLDEEQAGQLLKEMQAQQIRNKKGELVDIDELVKLVECESKADFSWGNIEHTAHNQYTLTSGAQSFLVDFNFKGKQHPPYPVHIDLSPPRLEKFGIEILGGATGFSSSEASSGIALCYNGNYMLIDCIPYINYQLRARGIAINQIETLFLTHVHDDHCNVMPLLQYTRKIKLLTTKLIYRMMVEKVCLQAGLSLESAEKYFEFVELIPGQETNYFGIKIKPFLSVHTIPTIGAHFSVSHAGKSHTITVTGDTQSLEQCRDLLEKGILTQERYDSMKEIYQQEVDLLVADGGEGSIHGDPVDCLQSPAHRIVILHVDTLSERYRSQFSNATSGKKYTIIRGNVEYGLTRTIEFLLEYFPDMSPAWISNLLADHEELHFNSDDTIVREGGITHGMVYMLLTGCAEVIRYENDHKEVLAEVQAGDLIGEMAVLTGQTTRNASVVAVSPVIAVAFSDATFKDFTAHQRYTRALENMWTRREMLSKFSAVANLPQRVMRRMAEMVESVDPEYASAIGQGSLIFPLDEKVHLEPDKHFRKISSEPPVYYISGFIDKFESATDVIVLNQIAAKDLCNRFPYFRFFWEKHLGLPTVS